MGRNFLLLLLLFLLLFEVLSVSDVASGMDECALSTDGKALAGKSEVL